MTGLSHLQKALVAQAARAAYAAKADRDAFERANPELTPTECFAAWRHVEQGHAVGIQSLCECTQAHYLPLLAHFQALAGQGVRAGRTLAREAGNDRRIAAHKLHEALDQRGLAEAYAAAICRRQYRCALAEATARQLWRLVFTIRNRRAACCRAGSPDPAANLAAAPGGVSDPALHH